MSDSARATRAAVAEILAGVDHKPASYLAAARSLAGLERSEALLPVRTFVLSSFTFELVVPYFVVEGARAGLAVTATCGPFGQLESQVLESTSQLYAFEPHVVVLAARIEDVALDLGDGFMSLTPESVDGAIAAYVERLTGLLRALRERCTARVMLWNQAPLRRLVAGLADALLVPSQQHAIFELNRRLAVAAGKIPNVFVFDVARIATEVGTKQWCDAKLQVLARIPLSAAAQLAVGKQMARVVRAMYRPPCKCLVLDLDNTLWGGVLGEDGLAGISLGEDHPGSVYKAFQYCIRGYRDRGVLLAIASKNNEADVAEVFATHADMVLRREDFAATQIHWDDKASSLRAIAGQLNIGVDALAFFDDSAIERAWVGEQLPEATVIDVPADPLRYTDALDSSCAFDQLLVTAEDRVRTSQYRDEAERQKLETSAGSLEEFLRSLQMKISIGQIDATTMPRAVQLLSKTNQFNVTTRRHTAGDLTDLLARDGAIGLWMRVSDRYGDSGLVGLGIAVPDNTDYRLDTFLMSCRVLGRKAEHVLLTAIVKRARQHGAKTLLGEFIATKKNAPAVGFFADAGFTPLENKDNWWQLDLASAADNSPLVEVIEES